MLKRDSHQERNVYVQQHTWSDAFACLAVAVAQLTLDARLLSANTLMAEIIGQPESKLLDKGLNEFFLPEESWLECNDGLRRLIAGETKHYSTNMRVRATGQPVWVN